MRCARASELMMDRLDGRLDARSTATLDQHLGSCSACQAEWRRICALDRLFCSATTVSAPHHLRPQIIVRIRRMDQARHIAVGGLALALAVTALTFLTLGPITVWLLKSAGIASTLLAGGLETIRQLSTLVGPTWRLLSVLLDQLVVPLTVLALGSLAMAVALNGLWVATVRKMFPTS